MRLDHVRLLVDDYGEAFRFYRDRLGLTPTYGDESGPYASFDTGPAAVSIFERRPQGGAVALREPGDGCLTILQVDDVDAEAGRLGLGEPVTRSDWGIRVAYLRDPSDNLIELYTPLPAQE